MSDPDVAAFRDRYRVSVLERLVLRHVLLAPVISRHLSGPESLKAIEDWLDANTNTADLALGQRLQEPALTALYAEEAKEVVERMRRSVRDIAEEAKATFEKHGQQWS